MQRCKQTHFVGYNRRVAVQEVANKLRKPDFPAYSDGKQALYVFKLMVLKMAHKDWTPVDRQWITSQAKRVRAAIPAAVHFGCEGALADTSVQGPERLGTGGNSDEIKDTSLVFEFRVSVGVWERAMRSVRTDAAAACSTAFELLELACVGDNAPEDSGDAGEVASATLNDSAENGAASGTATAASVAHAASHITLQVRVSLDDHARRLGTLREAQTHGSDAAPMLEVDRGSAEADLLELRSRLAQLLGLTRADKDPDEFRCVLPIYSSVRLVCKCMPMTRLIRRGLPSYNARLHSMTMW